MSAWLDHGSLVVSSDSYRHMIHSVALEQLRITYTTSHDLFWNLYIFIMESQYLANLSSAG